MCFEKILPRRESRKDFVVLFLVILISRRGLLLRQEAFFLR